MPELPPLADLIASDDWDWLSDFMELGWDDLKALAGVVLVARIMRDMGSPVA